MKKYLALLLIIFSSFGLIAEGEKTPENKGKQEQKQQNNQFGERFLQRMKEKDPEEFQRLSKLRKESPDKFREEVKSIWAKKNKDRGNNKQRPERGGNKQRPQERGSKNKNAEPFTEQYNRFRKMLEQAKKENPEEFKQMKKLRKEDPKKYKEEMLKKIKTFRKQRHPKSTPEIQDLTKKIRNTKDDNEKLLLVDELRYKLEEQFDKNIKMQKERLNVMQEKLQEMKKQIKDQEKKKQQRIDEHIRRIISGTPQKPHKSEDRHKDKRKDSKKQ